MEPGIFLDVADQEARALLHAAEVKWDRPVPHCPDWDAAGLVRHTGEIFRWMAAINTTRTRVTRRTMEPGPENPGELPPWYLAALDTLMDVLGSADPDSATWTFSSTGDERVRWWCRRVAVEVSIHRWDVERAMLTGMLAVAADATRDDTLHQVGIERARGLVTAVNALRRWGWTPSRFLPRKRARERRNQAQGRRNRVRGCPGAAR